MDVYQRRRLVALSVLAGLFIVFVLLIRSCGGDDEPSTEPLSDTGAGATAQTREAYIASADAICLETNSIIADIDETSDNALATEANALRNQLDQLRTLLPPEDGQGRLERFLDALQTQAQQLGRQATALERGDTVSADEIAVRVEEAAADAAAAAERFGFRVCGNPDEVESEGAEGEATGEGEVTPTEPSPTEVAPAVPETAEPAAPETGGAGAEPTAPPDDGGAAGGDTGGISP